MHPLQTTFASAAGEQAWEANLRALFEQRELAEAERILRRALIATASEKGGGEMMRLCRQASLEAIEITGWEELAEAVAAHEGDAITGATVAMGNEADLAFEKGETHRPYMVLGLYSDEGWNWSAAEAQDALEQCRGESPGWAGWDEDIEAFLEIEGLDALNTALIHHKQRHFIREEAEEAPAPLRYVEYVLGCWWRALRFHQAVAVQLDRYGLGGTIPVISGLIDMRPEVVAVHWPLVRKVPMINLEDDVLAGEEAEEAVPNLLRFNLIQRGRLVIEDESSPAGSSLRRRIETAEEAEETPAEEGPGLMRRLLGRG
ncbi:MAG: hypothetical protein GXC70_07625 [Sphingomonadaceae bacterium]|nr:hypothetical protein [Sphingomonadaceae bacterium]